MQKHTPTQQPLTPAQRKAAERVRRADAGLVRLELWSKPEHHAQIKAFAERLAAKNAPAPTRR